ncbi:MAG: hypothetical protein AABX93_01175, partial [Nanoarchaeota archaeon]
GNAVMPETAVACGNGKAKRTVLDALMPIVKNPNAIKTDADGKIYVRFSSDLKSINDISLNPENYDLKPSDGLEPVYQTLDEIMRNLESDTKYIVEIDTRTPLMAGQISNVYKINGKRLDGYSAYRCIGSPLKFSEK